MARNDRRRDYPYQMSDSFVKGQYYYENFKDGRDILWFNVTSGLPVLPLAATAAQGTAQQGISPAGQYWQFFNTTDQDIMTIGTAGSGLNIAGDLVNNESLELVPGGNSTASRLAFVAGTDPDFFIKTKWKLTDADGSDQFLVGFRKQEAFAVPTSFLTTGDGIYTDFFGAGFAATVTNPNVVKTASDLNNGGSTTVTDTSFDWADTLVHTLEVRVVGRKALVLINGVLLGNPVSKDGDGASITSQDTLTGPVFTFDSGDTLVPFIFLRHDTNVSESHFLQEIEVGRLVDVGKDPNNETTY